jgi:hypothetical protein
MFRSSGHPSALPSYYRHHDSARPNKGRRIRSRFLYIGTRGSPGNDDPMGERRSPGGAWQARWKTRDMTDADRARTYGVHREEEARMMRKFSATALTDTAGPLLTHSLILGAGSEYLAAEKTRKLNFGR